jgi:plasmid stability protein
MATLTIRNVDTDVKERLRMRAARHGRSMQAELRSILNDALARDGDHGEPNPAETIRRRFAPLGGVEPEPHPSVPIMELQAEIDRGLADLAAGRVQDFDAARIIERGRKRLGRDAK